MYICRSWCDETPLIFPPKWVALTDIKRLYSVLLFGFKSIGMQPLWSLKFSLRTHCLLLESYTLSQKLPNSLLTFQNEVLGMIKLVHLYRYVLLATTQGWRCAVASSSCLTNANMVMVKSHAEMLYNSFWLKPLTRLWYTIIIWYTC